MYADSLLFACSSRGILKQALTGTGREFKRIGNELRKYPQYDSGVGCALLGGFYHVTPWPVGSQMKAKELFAEGVAHEHCAMAMCHSHVPQPRAIAPCHSHVPQPRAAATCHRSPRKGVAIGPTRRNLYYVAVNAFQVGLVV